MKALSVRQPWANLIASGQKTIETRTWQTSYRGELLIVSSRRPDIYPAGCALAIVTLVDCRPMRSIDWIDACCDPYPGAFAWVICDVRKIDPIPTRGAQSLYDSPIYS